MAAASAIQACLWIQYKHKYTCVILEKQVFKRLEATPLCQELEEYETSYCCDGTLALSLANRVFQSELRITEVYTFS